MWLQRACFPFSLYLLYVLNRKKSWSLCLFPPLSHIPNLTDYTLCCCCSLLDFSQKVFSSSTTMPTNNDVHLIINAVGKDRLGIVSDVTGLVIQAGGNVCDSQAARLGPYFSLIMGVTLDRTARESLTAQLAALPAMQAVVYEDEAAALTTTSPEIGCKLCSICFLTVVCGCGCICLSHLYFTGIIVSSHLHHTIPRLQTRESLRWKVPTTRALCTKSPAPWPATDSPLTPCTRIRRLRPTVAPCSLKCTESSRPELPWRRALMRTRFGKIWKPLVTSSIAT